MTKLKCIRIGIEIRGAGFVVMASLGFRSKMIVTDTVIS